LWADNKDKAFKLLKEESIDLVLLDLELTPGNHEGEEILKWIRSEQLFIPVIVFTKFHEIDQVKTLLIKSELAADDYIAKIEMIESNNYALLLESMKINLYKYSKVRNKIGILITHGTDTMAFGFSVLKYLIKKYNINLSITGSQIPLSGYFSVSDAIGNLKRSLFVINRFRPPSLSFVFNEGEKIFDGSIRKICKSNVDGFEGNIIMSSKWWDDEIITKNSMISYIDQKLDTLYLIRTGGTIESEADPDTGALVATGDFVLTYITSTLQKEFVNGDVLPEGKSLKKDSSCLTMEHWFNVGKLVENICTKENLPCELDFNFAPDVYPLFLNPFYKSKDYEKMIDMGAEGFVVLGYGAGNGNIDDTEFSLLSVLKEKINESKFFVMNSQVPIDDYDFNYEAGRKFIEIGALPSGNLSFEESQVRLSYILGHKELILEKCREKNLDYKRVVKSLFIAGMKFKTKARKREAKKLTGLKIYGKDILADPWINFKEALDLILGII
jgi:L-asparaginase/Glu-tRNA(Gln) amidotransferase subunit D